MCHGSLISHEKVRSGARLRVRTEPSRAARNFAFGLTIMRHVPGKFINAPEGTARNYEWTVENNRPRRTKRSMRTVDPALHSLTLELKILFLALSPIDASKAHLDTFLTYISIDRITLRCTFISIIEILSFSLSSPFPSSSYLKSIFFQLKRRKHH